MSDDAKREREEILQVLSDPLTSREDWDRAVKRLRALGPLPNDELRADREQALQEGHFLLVTSRARQVGFDTTVTVDAEVMSRCVRYAPPQDESVYERRLDAVLAAAAGRLAEAGPGLFEVTLEHGSVHRLRVASHDFGFLGGPHHEIFHV